MTYHTRKPVISSTEYHTSKISKFVDHYLQLHAKTLPSYTQSNRFHKQTTILAKIYETDFSVGVK